MSSDCVWVATAEKLTEAGLQVGKLLVPQSVARWCMGDLQVGKLLVPQSVARWCMGGFQVGKFLVPQSIARWCMGGLQVGKLLVPQSVARWCMDGLQVWQFLVPQPAHRWCRGGRGGKANRGWPPDRTFVSSSICRQVVHRNKDSCREILSFPLFDKLVYSKIYQQMSVWLR